MGTITLTGKTRGTTRLTVKAGGITTDTPVTVKSANLLAYGALEIGGLQVTVNPDGSLHVKGMLDAAYNFVTWNIQLADIGVKAGDTLSFSAGDKPTTLQFELVGYRPGQASQSIGVNTILDPAVKWLTLRMRSRTQVDADLKPMLNKGSSLLDWMSPDVTNASGGGR